MITDNGDSYHTRWYDVIEHMKTNMCTPKQLLGDFVGSSILNVFKFHKKTHGAMNVFSAINSNNEYPKCIQINYELHVDEIIDCHNINEHIKKIYVSIGEQIIDEMDGHQLYMSIIKHNKKIIHENNKSIVPLCFSVFENYFPLMFLEHHEFNINIEWNDVNTDINCDVYAINIFNKFNNFSNEINYIMSQHCHFKCTYNNCHGQISYGDILLRLNSPVYCLYIKGISYDDIKKIEFIYGGYHRYNSVDEFNNFSVKYKSLKNGLVVVPVSDTYFKQVDENKLYEHGTVDSSRYEFVIRITSCADNCDIDVYYERYNIIYFKEGVSYVRYCT
jgi:hypothetical protein